MKRILSYVLLCALPLLAASCQKEEGTKGTMKGEFFAVVPGGDEGVEFFPGGSKTFDVRVQAHNGLVSDVAINFNITVDPSLVTAFNTELGTKYEMCPGSAYEISKPEVMMPRYGTSSTTGKIKVVASGLDAKKTYLLPVTIAPAGENGNYSVADTLSACIIFKQKDFDPEKGIGTQEAPFLIHNLQELQNMDSQMGGSTTFFLLTDDIDMSGVTTWVSLNAAGAKLDFDGGNHTIKNYSCGQPIFANIVGKIHDLNIVNAKVVSETKAEIGIVAAHLGSTTDAGEADHVSVQGSIENKGATGTAGLFAYTYNATINACCAQVDIVTNKHYAGGISGHDVAKTVISNCWSSGSINGAGARYHGGICGELLCAESSIYNCFTTMSIYSRYYFGGITGCANLGSGKNNATNDSKNHIEKCIAWNEFIESDVSDASEHYSCGAVVGNTATHNFHVDCYRKPGYVMKECPGNAGNVLIDHANSSPDSPLVVGLSGTYIFPYHGKAAAEGSTITSVAKKLGWDETIWDLSGDVPFFKGGSAPVEDPDVPSGGQLPDFDENEFYK